MAQIRYYPIDDLQYNFNWFSFSRTLSMSVLFNVCPICHLFLLGTFGLYPSLLTMTLRTVFFTSLLSSLGSIGTVYGAREALNPSLKSSGHLSMKTKGKNLFR